MNAAPGRLGPWQTVFASAAVLGVFVATQAAFASVYLAATLGPHRAALGARELERISRNGDVVAAALFLSAPACLLAIIAILKLKRGATFEDSLALRLPEPRALGRWMLAALALAALSDALTWLLGKPIVPEFMREVYGSAEGKGALWVAIVVAAPVSEEILFRGFIITGLASSRLGASGAVVLAALLWASIHMQYDAYGIVTIFVGGLLLGAARVKTQSVVTPLLMHVAMNVIATVEAANL